MPVRRNQAQVEVVKEPSDLSMHTHKDSHSTPIEDSSVEGSSSSDDLSCDEDYSGGLSEHESDRKQSQIKYIKESER